MFVMEYVLPLKMNSQNALAPYMSAASEKFRCPTCDYECSTKEILASHTLWHVQNRDVSLRDITQDDEELNTINMAAQKAGKVNNMLMCAVCDFVCEEQDHMAMHMLGHAHVGHAHRDSGDPVQAAQLHSGRRPSPNITCPVCKFQSSNRELIAFHLLAHERNNVSGFNGKASIIDLIRTGIASSHVGHSANMFPNHSLNSGKVYSTFRETYTCKTCSKQFHTPDDLGMHMMLHVKDEHKESPTPSNEESEETFLEVLKRNQFWKEFSLNRPKRGRPRGSSRNGSTTESADLAPATSQSNIDCLGKDDANNLSSERNLQRSFSSSNLTECSEFRETQRSASEPKCSMLSNAYEEYTGVDLRTKVGSVSPQDRRGEEVNTLKRRFPDVVKGNVSPLDLSTVTKRKLVSSENGDFQPKISCAHENNSNMDEDTSHPACGESILSFAERNRSQLFMCKYCNIIFVKKTLYCIHMGLHNLNNPLQCNLCGKVTKDTEDFFSHVIHYN